MQIKINKIYLFLFSLKVNLLINIFVSLIIFKNKKFD